MKDEPNGMAIPFRSKPLKDLKPEDLLVFAYTIPAECWDHKDHSNHVVIPRCPVCGRQHILQVPEDQRIAACPSEPTEKFVLKAVGTLPHFLWDDFRNKRDNADLNEKLAKSWPTKIQLDHSMGELERCRQRKPKKNARSHK